MQSLEEVELCFPQLINFSCRRILRPHSTSMLIYFSLSSLSWLTVTLNLLVIISIAHFKQLHTPTNILLLSLAVSDFFVGFLIIFQILLIDGCWYLGDLMCIIYYIIDYIITSASVENMVLISVDCYVAVCNPFQYPTTITQKRVCVCVSLCWMFSTVCVFIVFKGNLEQPGRFNSCSGECVAVFDQVAGLIDILFFCIGPVTVIIILYVRVFVVAVSQARAMRSHVIAISLQSTVKVNLKKSELKSARTLGVVACTFLICICPYFFLSLTSEGTELNVLSFAFFLFYLNSCLNPIIYIIFYPWFRKSIKLIFTLQILKPGSSEFNLV
ncbi:PREDICTED: trace amine-associated receptor 13c-like [Cyprinodon variegatus]|uniref:trace amine-associated receptor 13c-like n=1 Tax=Cyprinodon variegatus TaxID=28743 RepID=UPI0007427297|nr:PREDICTED: trace amine-associated receptor 13c-like [Cyprinodon variegatus]